MEISTAAKQEIGTQRNIHKTFARWYLPNKPVKNSHAQVDYSKWDKLELSDDRYFPCYVDITNA
jgi:hypothetical protein